MTTAFISGSPKSSTLISEALTEFDAIVLGAGISGLVSASILLEQGSKRVLVVDEYEHLGGNHIDHACEGYTFDVGSFIFQDDSPLLRHFPEILPQYVPIHPTFGRLNPQGVVTRYPFSVRDDLLAAGALEVARILLSVAYARVFKSHLTDARSFARYWIGDRLLVRAGLEKYLERFYGVEPAQIDLQFAHKRMLWIREHALLRTHIGRFARFWRPKGPQNTQLARPRAGFAALYRPARERLEKSGVTFQLGTPLRAVKRLASGFELTLVDGRVFSTDRLVSTIPIHRAQEVCGLPQEERLRTVTLISLYYSFAGDRRFSQPVLFNFSHDGAWKRLTMHSDFYGRAHGREYFGVEVNADHVGGSVERADEDFRSHTARNNIFVGDLKLEGSNVLGAAYPIYTEQAAQRAQRAIASLKKFGVESFGRQGGFDYQPTARVSTLQAESSLDFR
jgi:phytoene dehydrogenase-like protein